MLVRQMSDSCQIIFFHAEYGSYIFAFGTTNESKNEEKLFIYSCRLHGVAALWAATDDRSRLCYLG